jgi:hypothetical protein
MFFWRLQRLYEKTGFNRPLFFGIVLLILVLYFCLMGGIIISILYAITKFMGDHIPEMPHAMLNILAVIGGVFSLVFGYMVYRAILWATMANHQAESYQKSGKPNWGKVVITRTYSSLRGGRSYLFIDGKVAGYFPHSPGSRQDEIDIEPSKHVICTGFGEPSLWFKLFTGWWTRSNSVTLEIEPNQRIYLRLRVELWRDIIWTICFLIGYILIEVNLQTIVDWFFPLAIYVTHTPPEHYQELADIVFPWLNARSLIFLILFITLYARKKPSFILEQAEERQNDS